MSPPFAPRTARAATRPWPCGLAAILLAVCASSAAAAGSPGSRRLYLDFSMGGQSLVAGQTDDATVDRTALGAVTDYPPFYWPTITTGTETRAQVVRTLVTAVHRAFLPYDIVVGTQRPSEGPYTTVLIGGSPELFGLDRRVAGAAIMDCEDREPSNLTFAFPAVLMGNVHGLFVTIAQEAAHAYGLEHTEDPADLMHPTVGPAQRHFSPRDSLVVKPRICGPIVQNSHRRLLELVGPWTGGRKPLLDGSYPDIEPPTIAITQPAAGAVLVPPVAVEVTISDESALVEVVALFHGQRVPLAGPPYRVTLPSLTPGPATLTVLALDAMGNQGQAAVAFTANDAAGGCRIATGAGRVRAGGAAWALFGVWLVANALRRRGGTCRSRPLRL